jgi:hypothetical protein
VYEPLTLDYEAIQQPSAIQYNINTMSEEEPFDIGAKLKQRLETTKLQKDATQVRDLLLVKSYAPPSRIRDLKIILFV